MDFSDVVTPDYVATPFCLSPFRAQMLTASRVSDPSSRRAFARPYRDVARRLRRWERAGHLRHDPEPALYLHEYTNNGLTIRGLVGALDVSRRAESPRQSVVWPHEGIHPAQAHDLAKTMYEMRMNPGPILLVHRGPSVIRDLVRELLAAPPLVEYTDRAEHRQRVWAIRDEVVLDRIAGSLADSQVLIADGHHRYAAYLRIQHRHPGTAWDRGMAMLVDQDDTPLFLGAIHRVLFGPTFGQLRAAAAAAGHDFQETSGKEAAVAGLGQSTAVITDGVRWAQLDLSSPTPRAPVEVLHEDLVPAMPGPVRVDYFHTVQQALNRTRNRRSVAILLPAPSFDLVHDIVASGRLLPEKATSFQPKPTLGVLMRSLRDG